MAESVNAAILQTMRDACRAPAGECLLKKHVDELETLLTIQQAITSRLDLSEVLQLIADGAQRLSPSNISLFYILEADSVRLAAVSGEYSYPNIIGEIIPIDLSIAGPSIRSGQPAIHTDLQNEDLPGYRECVEFFDWIHCCITVPVIADGQILGVIAVADKGTSVLGPESLRILSMLSPVAVIGLENARLYQEQQQRRLEAESRHQMAEGLRLMLAILNSNRSLSEILDYVVEHVSNRLLDCDAMSIYSLEPDETLSLQASHGLAPELTEYGPYMPGKKAILEAISTQLPITAQAPQAAEIDSLPPEARDLTAQMSSLFKNWLAIPLMNKGEIYGAIILYYCQVHQFSEEEIGLILAFGDQVALSIENARLRTQAEKAAVIGERNRLARELHDAVSQTLFSTSLIAEVLPRLWDRDQAEGRMRLEELRQLTRGAQAEMRTLLFELRPSAIRDAQMSELLKHLVTAVSSRARIPISLTVERDRKLAPDVQMALYRIVQEALNNIVKYAYPQNVSIKYTAPPGKVLLEIEDDGCGFNPSEVSAEHLGIEIMRERAASIHAKMVLCSKTGSGTKICISRTENRKEV